jgi:hypothetical protein
MYLRHLTVEHLKRLARFELDFTHQGKPRMWTVFIGENGTAKTTLLQAVALAAAGSKQVNTLVGPAVKYLRDRRSERPMEISATFDFSEMTVTQRAKYLPLSAGHQTNELSSWVGLQPKSTALDAHAAYGTGERARLRGRVNRIQKMGLPDPLDAARSTNTPHWFVAGYGISRALPDANMIPTLARPSLERLEPLFGPFGLVSTGFANHFLRKDAEEGRRAGTTSRRFSKVLKQAMKLGGADLFPDLVNFELRGYGGAKSSHALIESDRFSQRMAKGQEAVAIAGVALSHGYQSTFAWIADLIGHVLLEAKTQELKTTEMEGLVLIDEIDLYLHPTWQANFIPALRRVFPKMQFIATTHSPVVLSSLAPHEIVRLVVDPTSGDIVQGGWSSEQGQFEPGIQNLDHQPDPRMMTGGELYRTWFGLEGTTPNPLGDELRRYQLLLTHPSPTPFQREERRALKAELLKSLEARLGKSEGRKAFREFEQNARQTT